MDDNLSADLDPADPASWAGLPFDVLLSQSIEDVAEAQRDALARRFEALRPSVPALDKLATRQGVERVDAVDDALPVFFDHRVLKSYPLSLIERRQFDRLTAWLQRLTTRDLTSIPLDDVVTVDDWIQRLDDNGMFLVHSTGTTGKLSFVPRSQTEYPAWEAAHFEGRLATSGIDLRTEKVHMFSTSYRAGHQSMAKMGHVLAEASAGGEAYRHPLYDYTISSDLLSLAGRLQGAEDRGELDKLAVDPALLRLRVEFIERARRRNEDLEQWFTKLALDYRDEKVFITGSAGDLVRLALTGRNEGVTCDFAPGSVLFTGGGLKGLQNPPEDWPSLVKEFFGIDRFCGIYGMSECTGLVPKCSAGFYHFFPYTIPIVLDDDANALPRHGVQTGRMALFDLLAETYWGGFVTSDRVTIHWDADCECGWRSPRLADDITRYGEIEGGDDKITCAGTAEAYNEFMDYVSTI